MARLDKDRQIRLESKRIEIAVDELEKKGIPRITVDDKKIEFPFKNQTITFYPYSGWHTGKGIKDGRGLKNLLKQL